ncbi:LEAF RUST 10 DISEASE-RESISTANCE LOCUS RECEPTOR-LIKE PROTEIN KINASE-like 1.1 [Impatiens glandulifera]|uniref:LEAF RUST 10 DISEASE-RESISTANCE LOCUS RECEPTOR-LIKE PROTEIN KINASE-like 1.1 n=1 Tax=Impatiens glandulifera TaxID=253017 RepID=UPI001FB1A044|nr:LEAF RUST 10 DISEASE-RESISTANCE LOCUS RECEPTOR-LIKE PROTEIN KINASE-like 1.1 [Impatiens glandulifera]
MGSVLIPFSFSLFFLLSYDLVLSNPFRNIPVPPNNSRNERTCPPEQYISCRGHDYLLKLPLKNFPYPDTRCGLWTVDCSDHDVPTIQNAPYDEYSLETIKGDSIIINDTRLASLISDKDGCGFVEEFFTFPRTDTSKSISIVNYSISPNMTVFKCSDPPQQFHFVDLCPDNLGLYFSYSAEELIQPNPTCHPIVVPIMSETEIRNPNDLFSLLASQFTIQLHLPEPCSNECHPNRNAKKITDLKRRNTIILATVLPGGFLIMVGVFIFIIWQRKRLKNLFFYRPFSRKSSSRTDLERPVSEYFGASVFTYEELEKATKNFDQSKELGDGGFGAVYHGKLSDGREVAVKRLYQHNCKRIIHFMNEVKILTGLRHPNLVTLYGCTSRHSRELLLVYEYISNGTIYDHLHGDLIGKGLLDWPIRLKVAIETAEALSYLHHINIIHRDVKTTNILLDENFSVKVADFGLSRPLPNNVTHVSTAPQGTPGYVDPEYFQCYQLTEKSDVYSFGVVLVELISSMPAVDIGRHRHEINLANLAINRIQDCAFDGLIDPGLGYKIDHSVRRMTTCVAELAFRCLQNEKDFRPTMDEVVKILKEIRDYKDVHKSRGRNEGE